ncbi:MAG: putative bifunctional diguanylate cyclase/phosphodiesterase [Vulcanococcus sp.]
MSTPGSDEYRRLEREIRRLRHELQEAMRALPYLRQMVQYSGDLLILVEASGRILEANGRFAERLGLPQEQIYGQPLQRWLSNPGQLQVLEARLAAGPGAPLLRMELDLQPVEGELLAMELEGHQLQPERWTLSLRDLSERRRLESSEAARQVQDSLIASLRGSEARYRDLVSQLADGLGQVDAATTLLFANPALHRILAVPEGELVGCRLLEFLPPASAVSFEQTWDSVLQGMQRQCTLTMRAADGTFRQVELNLHPRPEAARPLPDGPLVSVLLRDVTALSRALTELTELAFHDPLTGLANAEASRRDLEARLAANAHAPVLVLWLDLDGFRRVNHTLGRAAGDALLQGVADRLRSWGGPTDLRARLGGDEFLLVLQLPGPAADPDALHSQAEAVLRDLRAALRQLEPGPEATPMALGFSAGYSLAPLHGTQAEDLLKAAATALSLAREQSPGTALAYEPRFTTRLQREMALEARLVHALDHGGLRLVYQPQNDAQGCLLGAEALLRWDDPLHGTMSPARFVPLAERTGLIHPLGQWVLEEACRQLRVWLDAGLRPPRLAVNLSARQFELTVPSLPDQVSALLNRYALPPDQLELEITESCIVPMVGVTAQVQQLAELGVQVALDDFGTGYSSLAVLNQLAIKKLKIDRSFIEHLDTRESARTIVRTALAMGRGLGLETLAEGVETSAQLKALQALGCEAYQGFWFSRPLEADAFTALLPRRDASGLEDVLSSAPCLPSDAP